VVSWTSLLVGEVRLRTLRIDRPRMSIRRDTSGRIDVAGIEFDPRDGAASPGFSAWLLNQREIVVKDALVTWNDDLRNAPQLLLDQSACASKGASGGIASVSRARRRRRSPPRSTCAATSRRCAGGGWDQANGRMYVRLDFADVAAWSEWLPLPIPLQSGEGALRLWFDVHDGVPDGLVADVELANVRARLAENLPPLDLVHVAGRIAFERSGARYSITARELSFVAADGIRVVPADVAVRYELGGDGETRNGRIA